MPVIQRSAQINAPSEKVFAIMDDPHRSAEWVPSITRVSDITHTPKRIGDSSRMTYAAMGLRFPMKVVVQEWEKNRRLVLKMEGGIGGAMAFGLEAQGNSTRVSLRIDYTMKGGIIGRAANAVLVERMNVKNAERMLENLKLVSEGVTAR